MLSFLLQQERHNWSQLGVWHRFQSLLLWGFVLFLAAKQTKNILLAQPQMATIWVLVVLQGLSLSMIVMGTAQLKRGLASYLPLSLLRSLPLNSVDLVQLFVFSLLKIWRWGWFFVALFTFTFFGWNSYWAFLFLFLTLGAIFAQAFFLTTLFLRFAQRPLFLILSGGLIVGTGLLALLAFHQIWWSIFATGTLMLVLVVVGSFFLKNANTQLEDLYPLTFKIHRKYAPQKIIHGGLAKLFILREILNIWRNPASKRNKWLIMAAIPTVGYILFSSFAQEKAVTLSTLWIFLLLWWHYSQFFNPQFGQKEPLWFIRSLPLPFASFVLAKFVAEFTYIVLVLLTFSLTLSAAHIPLNEHWQLLLFLCFVSIVMLLSLIHFQIIFYDDLRTAGFAFHFSVLFFTALTLFDYFIGPILTLIFWGLYTFKSYRLLRS